MPKPLPQRPERLRRYTDDFRAEVLCYLAACGNMEKTARDYKIPSTTIQAWRNGSGVNEVVTVKSFNATENLADMFERLVRKIAPQMEAKIDSGEESLRDLNASMNTSVDKMRLLRGETTENVGVGETKQNVRDRLQSLSRAGKLNAGNASPPAEAIAGDAAGDPAPK